MGKGNKVLHAIWTPSVDGYVIKDYRSNPPDLGILKVPNDILQYAKSHYYDKVNFYISDKVK